MYVYFFLSTYQTGLLNELNFQVGIVSSTSCPSGYILCTNISCGTPSTQPGTQDGFAIQSSFPWHVFLRNNNNLANRNGYAGGGVLLDPVTVLTAAHKVSNL